MRLSVLLLSLALVGCGSSKSGSVGQINPTNLSGNWTGMLNSSNATHSRTVDLFTIQSGTMLNSPRLQLGVTQALTNCNFAGTMNGTTSNGQTTFSIVIPAKPPRAEEGLALSGSVKSSSISGSYTEMAGCLKGETGTFQISPAASITSSQWSGTWVGPFGTTGSASADLSEDSSANITGTLTLGNGACDSFGSAAANVTGTMTGLIVNVNAQTPVGIWNAGGALDAKGRTLSLGHVCSSVEQRLVAITLRHS